MIKEKCFNVTITVISQHTNKIVRVQLKIVIMISQTFFKYILINHKSEVNSYYRLQI